MVQYNTNIIIMSSKSQLFSLDIEGKLLTWCYATFTWLTHCKRLSTTYVVFLVDVVLANFCHTSGQNHTDRLVLVFVWNACHSKNKICTGLNHFPTVNFPFMSSNITEPPTYDRYSKNSGRVSNCRKTTIEQFPAISWCEQGIFWRDCNVCFILDQHAESELHIASSIKQQSTVEKQHIHIS